MPVADKNNSLATAKYLGVFTGRSVKSAFGDIGFSFKQGKKSSLDKQDFHRISLLAQTSSASITLKGLKQDADLEVYNAAGQQIRLGSNSGRAAEVITLPSLVAGNYYLKVTPGAPKAKTKYQLLVSVSPVVIVRPPRVNRAPTVTTSALTAARGSLTPASTTITNSFLNATDGLSTASQLTYTLTSNTQSGSLFRNNVPLGVGNTFTQADINSGLLTYQQKIIKAIPTSEGVVGEPVISGSNVAWISGSGTSADVYFYNGVSGTTTRLTNDGLVNSNVQISGSTVVWDTTFASGERDVQYSINGASRVSINTSGDFSDFNPKISGSRIVFQRDQLSADTDDGIYPYDTGTQTTFARLQNSNAGLRRTLTGITTNNVVWTTSFGTAPNIERDVYFHNRSTGTTTTLNSDPDFDDSNPLISSTHVAFKRNQLSGNTSDGLYLYNIGTATTSLVPSSNLVSIDALTLRDIAPDSSNLVWDEFLSGIVTEKAYFSNGTQSTALTESATGRGFFPSLSSTNVAFRQNAGRNGIMLYYSTQGTYQYISTDFTDFSVPFISGDKIVWKNVASDSSSRLLFYDGASTNDSFGFTVSDGSLSSIGTLSIS